MKKADVHLRRFMFLLCWLLSAVALPVSAASADDSPLRICFMPCSDEVKIYKKTQPLAGYLETVLGKKIIIQVPHDYGEYCRIIRKGKTDFAFQSSYLFLHLENNFKENDLLTSLSVNGKPTCGALLITRSDSPINRIEDIRGKTVLFGPEFSTAKTLAAKTLLKQHGIDLENDLQEYRYGDSCKQIALNIYLKTADAGFICSQKYSCFKGEKLKKSCNKDCWPFPPESLKVIARTEENITTIVSAMKSVDDATHRQVKKALLALNQEQHKDILEVMESGGYAEIQNSDLRMLRNLIRQP